MLITITGIISHGLYHKWVYNREWETRHETTDYEIKMIKFVVGGQRQGESMKIKGQIGVGRKEKDLKRGLGDNVLCSWNRENGV